MMSDVVAIEEEITKAKIDLNKAKLVHSKANFLTIEANEQINRRIDAISFFIQYLSNIELNGASAEVFIAESEDLLDQIQGEESDV